MPTPLVKRTANGLLGLLRNERPGHVLPGEVALSARLGVSRSPLRSALRILARRGVLRREDGATVLARAPKAADAFAEDAGHASKADAFEAFFLAKLDAGALGPGTRFSELELAREAGCSTVTAREALLKLARLGVIEKEPRHRWRAAAFDERAIDELFDLRELLEQAALDKALALPDGHPLRDELADVLAGHKRLAAKARPAIDEFLALDERLHGALFAAAGNRYLTRQSEIVSMTIRFQLRSAPVGRRGMAVGLIEHQPVIEAVLARDRARARASLSRHLASARVIMKLAAGAHSKEPDP